MQYTVFCNDGLDDVFNISFWSGNKKNQLAILRYNFGGLEDMSPKNQIDMLRKHGYDGMTVMANFKNALTDLKPFFKYADEHEDFEIYSVFFRYNFNDSEAVKSGWKTIIDKLQGRNTDLWIIFGRPVEGFTPELIERVLRDVVAYAETKNVKVSLYPHHYDVIQTAEEAYKLVTKINAPNLDLAVHSCHEIRSGNGDRIEEVLENVKDKLAHVTIAGSDTIVDYTNAWTVENSTIKPLYRGTYDVSRILKQLANQDYKGAVGFINHLIKENPDMYLPKTREVYNHWLKEINKPKVPSQAYDAPDQCTYHAPSNTWFVSNLGGGISLDRDNYGWITRIDAEGNVIDPVWIGLEEGMHAPSGMTITDTHLYVCDRDGVHEIDIENKKITNFYPTPEGEFINDIAMATNGDLYVSDFFGNRIYKIPAKTKVAEVWLQSDRLETPDGLYMDKDKLIVVSWGVLSEPGTFNTSKFGDILSIDLKTKK
ncbi:TIM barrel protein [Jejuia pallidilutea]|uniref:TIM barrel protein n=1 Tax=Jejuia pallidilutea TaxID=504487 RepID=UPI0005AA5CF7|nr:TIM barrel protein [Jejuia pallidilutea]